jgi:PAS domain S-box-containing protein
MEGDLTKERDFITAVLQACGALVVVFDSEGRIVLSNAAFERVMEYSGAELAGKRYFSTFWSAPESREQSRKRLEDCVTAGTASAFESEWIAKSGEPRRISFSNVPMLNEQGEG